jgi:hypothetical protein
MGMGWVGVAGLVVLLPARGLVAQQPARAETYADRLVREAVARHPEALEAVELALVTGSGCRTVSATHREDVGEKCDADENGPMRTGRPDVEAPSKADPVYDITQALHDASGKLIGAVGMDIKPQPGEDREAVVAFARAVRAELEARIPSKAKLLERAAP